MRLDELLRFAGRRLEEERIPYYVVGATAMNFWVPPRNTIDLDVVVAVDKRRARSLLAALRKHGIPVTKAIERKFLEGRFVKIRLGLSDLDLKRCTTRHEAEALARAQTFAAGDYRLRIATPEDLILLKLQAWRRQDQADVERMLRQRKDLDVGYVEAWLDALAAETGAPMRRRWDEIRAS